MFFLLCFCFDNCFSQNWRDEKAAIIFYFSGIEGRDERNTWSGNHCSDQVFDEDRICFHIQRIIEIHIPHSVLVINRDQRNFEIICQVSGHRFKISDHSIRLEIFKKFLFENIGRFDSTRH